MKPQWKSGVRENTLERSGLIGGNAVVSNAIVIERGYHYNGSGKTAFGGADKWPHVTLSVGFCAGQEKEAAIFVRHLQRFIDLQFPLNDAPPKPEKDT